MIDKETKAGEYIPPAFPLHNHGAQTLGMHLTGMSLRDYFAAKAMQGLFSHKPWNIVYRPEDWAKESYQMADAMLKARNENY
jgi:hypothetical protein